MLVLPLLAAIQVALAVQVAAWPWGPGHLAITSVGLLLALITQGVLGETGQVVVHVSLGWPSSGSSAPCWCRPGA